jgi:mRNA-degrading endonuclease RelE of RelBE toxin-antitoxin system
MVPEQDDPAVREILRGAYRIIYEVVREPDAVFVCGFGMELAADLRFQKSDQARWS